MTVAVLVLTCAVPAAAWVRGYLREARELSPRAWRAGLQPAAGGGGDRRADMAARGVERTGAAS